jgi:hypothetical protein
MTGLAGTKTAARSRALRDGLLRGDVDLADFRGDVRIGWIVTTLLLCWWTPG